ncbi:TetR/AcrR family transcriptional regulator [Nocardiopsis chromatogenes]|uniref:TetR/AcrR family transcriptional regulator n=1 Tax=Nocardiopsis chromatogenes TaxID=280239 RepID=UPI0003471859|nr:TetR/AcrR family transcriptional regulator [Nocardiopsis chromatogenes]
MSARREATRQRLFQATLEEVSAHGLDGVTVDRIAERAGLAKGTVYYNFGGKNELFSAFLEWGVDRFAAMLREGAVGPPREALSGLVRAELQFIAEYEDLARLLLSESWRTNQAWEATALRIRRQAIDVFTGLLDAVQAEGGMRPGLDTGVAGSAVFGMALTAALEWRTLDPDRPLEEVHAVLMRLVDDILRAERA